MHMKGSKLYSLLNDGLFVTLAEECWWHGKSACQQVRASACVTMATRK